MKSASRQASHYDRWLKEITALHPTNPLRVPYDVGLREAGQVASFMETYWEPAAGRPHLSRVKSRLPRSVAEEIRSLVAATQEAQTRLLLLVDPIVLDVGDRARFVVDELESALDFLLDDDVHEAADEQLAQIKAFHAQDGQRSSALAQLLHDYAALADELKTRLVEADGAFDAKLIAEARTLSGELRAAPAGGPSEDVTAATNVRNGMLALLMERVTKVRRAAAHVFRSDPAILREATSAFQRRRRAAARRAKGTVTPAAPPGAPVPPKASAS